MSGLNAGGSYRPLIVEMALSTPNFLTCSLWAVNTVIMEERLLRWRSRTRPIRTTSWMGASTHGPTLGVMAQTGQLQTVGRHEARFTVFSHLRDRERTMGLPQRVHITRREDRAVLEIMDSNLRSPAIETMVFARTLRPDSLPAVNGGDAAVLSPRETHGVGRWRPISWRISRAPVRLIHLIRRRRGMEPRSRRAEAGRTARFCPFHPVPRAGTFQLTQKVALRCPNSWLRSARCR